MAMITHASTSSDPIFAAIAAHLGAYAAYQRAPEGRASEDAAAEYGYASDGLVSVACSTRFGALALLEHLRWWTDAEREFSDAYQPAYGIAEARAADLTLFLGTAAPQALATTGPAADVLATFLPIAAPSGRLGRPLSACDRYRHDAPSALANEALPGEPAEWEAITPLRPDTEHVRAPRFLDRMGEALAALAVIGCGAVLTGFATLL